jgi:hypothetical protein
VIVALPAFANLPNLGDEWLAAFASMCVRNGWDPAGILTVIYFETGGTFDPSIQFQTSDTKTGRKGRCLDLDSPKTCAVGLLQWNRDGAAASGLPATRASLEKIASMNGLQQLDLIEKFFQSTIGHRRVDNPADYYLAVLGRADTINSSDWTSLYADLAHGGTKQSNRAYQANRGLDVDSDGVIRVGDMRAVWRHTLARAGGKTIGVAVNEWDITRPVVRPTAAPVATAALAFALIGVLIFKRAA